MIAIIDYEAGNLTSVARAISYIGYENIVTSDLKTISEADSVIFPGVGSAGSAMESLKRFGLDSLLKDLFDSGKPIMGICLGTQIILKHSEEQNTDCVGLVDGNVPLFNADMKDNNGSLLKIPHMGWNHVNLREEHPVLKGLSKEDEFYFVHSYYPQPVSEDFIIGTTFYGVEFASIIGYKNLIATQFHPEKSGEAGLNILKNFCEWTPC